MIQKRCQDTGECCQLGIFCNIQYGELTSSEYENNNFFVSFIRLLRHYGICYSMLFETTRRYDGNFQGSTSRCVHDVAVSPLEFAQDWIKSPTALGNKNVMYSYFCPDFKNA